MKLFRACLAGYAIGVAVVCALALIASGCGPDATFTQLPAGPKGDPGSSCTVKQETNGAIISCPDGSTAFVSNGTSASEHCKCSKKQCKK